VGHWQCANCGLRSSGRDSSQCSKSSARFLKLHEWVSAFDLAEQDESLVWDYESRDEFRQAQTAIRSAGWFVEKVVEAADPLSVGRVALRGPAAWLGRPKHPRATLRKRKEQARPQRRRTRRQAKEDTLPQPEAIEAKPPVSDAVETPEPLPEELEPAPQSEAAPEVEQDEDAPDDLDDSDGLLYYRRKI
jgi:hypothetical protein